MGKNQKLTTFERPKEFRTEPITLVDMIQGTPKNKSHVWLKLDRSLINKSHIYTIILESYFKILDSALKFSLYLHLMSFLFHS